MTIHIVNEKILCLSVVLKHYKDIIIQYECPQNATDNLNTEWYILHIIWWMSNYLHNLGMIHATNMIYLLEINLINHICGYYVFSLNKQIRL